MRWVPLLIGALMTAGCHRAPAAHSLQPTRRLDLTFVPESSIFVAAAREYEQLWSAEGDRIVRAMQSVSGLTFRDTAVRVIVFEGVSSSGFRGIPMRMRASYAPDTKKATLIHELGHRLMSGLFRREEEEHGPLFLWLYDVWVQLYGREFADAEVEVERRRAARYDKAWRDALALSADERAARWRALVAERLPTRR